MRIPDIDKVAQALPQDLVDAIREHGFSKLAAAVTQTPVDSEHAVYQKIGQDLMLRLREWRSISQGLKTLGSL